MGVVMAECNEQIVSQRYADYIIEYGGREQDIYDTYPTNCVQIYNARYGTIHLPVESMNGAAGVLGYHAIPKLYGLMDTSSMDASGITQIQNQQYLNLNGDDVIVGIIDTGIDYTNPLFRRTDGMTRLVGIWDQSYTNMGFDDGIGANDRYKPSVRYGRAYSTAEINEALMLDNPGELLPLDDTNGHGTFLTGIAAGGRDWNNDFTGAAPRSDIAVVKLKPAKNYLRDYYLIREDALAFQENDIMAAVDYLLELSGYYRKPIAICIGLGTASGSHTGTSFLCRYLDYVGSLPGVAISAAAGNESNRGSHFLGKIEVEDDFVEVELRTGEDERGFVTELWGLSPDLFRVGFVSPSGQVIEPIQGVIGQRTTIDFVVEPTKIFLYYQITDYASGSQVVFIRFMDPAPGVWRIRVYGENLTYGDFHMWLPISQFKSEDTIFLDPQPDSTVTSPGDCKVALCAGAYNHYNNSIYIYSGRGFAPDGAIYPSLCAPGVDVFGPTTRERYGNRSGTSISAAHVCGACALILQWAFYQRQMIFLTSEDVKQYLVRGARREEEQSYPNRLWGFGILDVYHSFEIFLT